MFYIQIEQFLFFFFYICGIFFRKGMTTLYLSTHDKQDFYKHLGFIFCDPIVSFGVNTDNLPEGFVSRY